VETGSQVQEVSVVAGNSGSFGIVFTPAKPGWEAGKLVLKLKVNKGPSLKVTVPLNGYGGAPALTLSRNGQPFEDSLALGVVPPHSEIYVMDVINAGDASGFITCCLFEDEAMKRPLNDVSVVPEKAVIQPGASMAFKMKAKPDCCAGFRSAYLLVYQGSEMARQVRLDRRLISCKVDLTQVAQTQG